MQRLHRCGLAVGWLAVGGWTRSVAQQVRLSQHERAAARAVAAASRAIVFSGVTIIDVTNGGRQPNQTVVIVGNRLRAIGAPGRIRIPKRARLLDAHDKYLIPGLWDMHAHPLSAAAIAYPLFVAYGVTGIRDAGSATPLATLTQWKKEIAAGTRVGPRLFVAGPSIMRCPRPERFTHSICVSTTEEARRAVDSLKAAGADFIKPHDPGSRELELALIAEARRVGLPVGGHFPSVPGQEASDSGASFLDHYTWFNPNVCGEPGGAAGTYDREQCTAAAERLRRNGTWFVNTDGGYGVALFPTMYYEIQPRYLPDTLAKEVAQELFTRMTNQASSFHDLPPRPASFADWQAALRRSGMPPRNWQGMPMVVGTDIAGTMGVPGLGVHCAITSFVLGGMTPLEALQTATLNPAKAMRLADSLGTVATGKVADLVLLDGDPLEDIWNTSKIHAVVANGRYFDRAALDALMAQAARSAQGR